MNEQFLIERLPEIKLIGFVVETNMEKASVDCPLLWQNFGARLFEEVPKQCDLSKHLQGSLGVSQMIDQHRFNYWVMLPVEENSDIPQGMVSLTIPSSLYVKAAVPNLTKLGETFMTLYETWPQSQNEYSLDMQGFSFELYPYSWEEADAFHLYATILNK